MKTPVSAAEGTEAGHLNTLQRDGTGAVPGGNSKGTQAQATQPSAAPTQCNCAPKTCNPEQNEGARCWRSGFRIPVGYFSQQNAHTSGASHE